VTLARRLKRWENWLWSENPARGDFRQGEVTAALQKPLGPLDATRGDVLVGASPVAGSNCRAKW
jgi:hypothetical protein